MSAPNPELASAAHDAGDEDAGDSLAGTPLAGLGTRSGSSPRPVPSPPPGFERWPCVAVIMPAYNDPRGARTCAAALARQTYPADRVRYVVVDNGSDEPLAPALAAAQHVEVIVETKPGSYAARNAGIAATARGQQGEGDVLAFTDADCIPVPTWLEAGVRELLAAPDHGARTIVGGRVDLFFRNPARPTIVEAYDVATAFDMRDFIRKGGYVGAGNLMCWRSLIEEIGPFDGERFSGGDVEFSRRATAAGVALRYSEEALVYHPPRTTWREMSGKAARIAGGIRDRFGGVKYFLHAIRMLFLPSPKRLYRAYRGPLLSTRSQRRKAVLGAFGMRYIEAWHRLRLALGAKKRR